MGSVAEMGCDLGIRWLSISACAQVAHCSLAVPGTPVPAMTASPAQMRAGYFPAEAKLKRQVSFPFREREPEPDGKSHSGRIRDVENGE